jgi:RecJ-like exonuclease
MMPETAAQTLDAGQTLIDLSRQKWGWMAERNMEKLEQLFHPSARFVHMGATMDRKAELDVIRSGQIQYKQANIHESSIELLGDTAIVYSRLRLIAVVGGNEVTNPFSVTEVYVRREGKWQLASMAFTRLLGD